MILPKIDWTLYLERKQSLFLATSFVKPYSSLLKKSTGFEYKNQLHSMINGMVCFYRSESEIEKSCEYFMDLILNNDPRLVNWASKGKEFNIEADALIEKYKGNDLKINSREEAVEILNFFQSLLLYSTIIPFQVLMAINKVIEKGEGIEKYESILSLYEPLRNTTRYPQIMNSVFPAVWSFCEEESGQIKSDQFQNFTFDEIFYFLSKDKDLSLFKLEERKADYIFWLDYETNTVPTSSDISLITDLVNNSQLKDIIEIPGKVSYPGKVSGVVRVINNVDDIKEFNDGDIIVSKNTSPSLMSVLLKCGGIVTDEGGIMCHASIISRELKKPGIIGTKIATKVLKDGDIVELDADKGIVKIIK